MKGMQEIKRLIFFNHQMHKPHEKTQSMPFPSCDLDRKGKYALLSALSVLGG